MKTGLMATYPARRGSLRKCLPSILLQLDQLYIYCNQYKEKQLRELVDWLGEQESECQTLLIDSKASNSDIRDMGKFWKLKDVDGIVFLLDDDLWYPKDYCQRHIKAIELHQCITCVHGRVIKNHPMQDYFGDTQSFHYRFPLKKPKKVHIAGTGTTAFKASYLPEEFRPSMSSFSWYAGMADIWFAKQAVSHGLKILCLSRDRGWLHDVPTNDKTLYDEAAEDNVRQCAILNKFNWDD